MLPMAYTYVLLFSYPKFYYPVPESSHDSHVFGMFNMYFGQFPNPQASTSSPAEAKSTIWSHFILLAVRIQLNTNGRQQKVRKGQKSN